MRRAAFTLAFSVLLLFGIVVGLDIWSFVTLELVVVAGMFAIDRVTLSRPRRAPATRDPLRATMTALARDGWRAIDDVALRRGTVDHVVIGPGGVFAVAARDAKGEADLDRPDELSVRRVHHHAMALDDLIRHPVVPLLVLRGADLQAPVALPRGVVVLSDRLLLAYLRRTDAVVSVAGVAELHGRLLAVLGTAARTAV